MWREYDKISEEMIEQAYEWSQNLKKTAFPIFCDGVKTKADFFRWFHEGLERENEHILLYQVKNKYVAWCHYFVMESERQLGLCTLLFGNENPQILQELLEYFKKNYPRYELRFYIPKENTTVHEALCGKYPVIDQSFVDILHIDKIDKAVQYHTSNNSIMVTDSNFSTLTQFLEEVGNSGWTGDYFKGQLDKWSIFMTTENEKPIAAIITNQNNLQVHEIFAILSGTSNLSEFVKEELIHAAIRYGQEKGVSFLYFFSDEDDHKTITKLGFDTVTEATCYQITF